MQALKKPSKEYKDAFLLALATQAVDKHIEIWHKAVQVFFVFALVSFFNSHLGTGASYLTLVVMGYIIQKLL